jgi:hypothetical protein
MDAALVQNDDGLKPSGAIEGQLGFARRSPASSFEQALCKSTRSAAADRVEVATDQL